MTVCNSYIRNFWLNAACNNFKGGDIREWTLQQKEKISMQWSMSNIGENRKRKRKCKTAFNIFLTAARFKRADKGHYDLQTFANKKF